MSAMTSTSAFGGQVAFKASQPARRTSPAAPRRQQICCGAISNTSAARRTAADVATVCSDHNFVAPQRTGVRTTSCRELFLTFRYAVKLPGGSPSTRGQGSLSRAHCGGSGCLHQLTQQLTRYLISADIPSSPLPLARASLLRLLSSDDSCRATQASQRRPRPSRVPTRSSCW